MDKDKTVLHDRYSELSNKYAQAKTGTMADKVFNPEYYEVEYQITSKNLIMLRWLELEHK